MLPQNQLPLDISAAANHFPAALAAAEAAAAPEPPEEAAAAAAAAAAEPGPARHRIALLRYARRQAWVHMAKQKGSTWTCNLWLGKIKYYVGSAWQRKGRSKPAEAAAAATAAAEPPFAAAAEAAEAAALLAVTSSSRVSTNLTFRFRK
ncbi:hypothetical protein COCOBI_18-1250 [Coccomyxa sp. Obi]|nr:hypothetical protein COCOBI_18-1250 [Coccomyxa sp. Obi]